LNWKKRNNENPIDFESLKDNNQLKQENSNLGQKLESNENNNIPESHDDMEQEDNIDINNLMEKNNIENLKKEKKY